MERTNQTASGYTYNGQNFTNQTRTDSQGNQYTVAIPSAISASSLQTPQATLPVTQPQYNTATQQSQASQANAYVNNAYNTAQTQADQDLQQQQDAYKQSNTDVALLQSQMGGKGQDLVNAYNQQDQTGQSVNTLAGKLRQLNAQSQALGLDTLARQQQEINKATGQNITQSAVQRNTADSTRQNLIDTARIAMESAIVKADYDTAKSYADQMVTAKYDQKLADIEAAKTNLEGIKYSLTSAEKKVAEATAQRLAKEKADTEKKMADEKQVNDMIIQASPVAPPDVMAKAKAIQAKGGSGMEVAMALGQYGGDYLKNELLKEQLKQLKTKTTTVPSNGREVVTQNGVELVKVTPKEIQDLNDTQIAKNSLVSLVDSMITSIDKYGTQVLFGTEAGTRSGAKTNLLLAMKNLEKTGALDKGTIDVLTGTIPDSKFFATEAAQKAALKQLKNTVVNKTDEYINSYKGTTAETDPRTKRIYGDGQTGTFVVPQGVSSAGASYAQSTMSTVDNVNNQVNTQQSYSGYDTGIK